MQRNIINNKKKKGFTLIEIMVAVAIMLVLMGFLVPKLAGYRAKAMEAKAINTGKQIYSAAMTSYSMKDGKFIDTDIDDVVKNATGITPVEISVDSSKTNESTIKYTSDGNDYSVFIDAANGTYQVTKIDGEKTSLLFEYKGPVE